MASTIQSTGQYSEEFVRAEPGLAAGAPNWLTQLRRGAITAFAESGLPTRKSEEWRFTPIPQIVETTFKPARPSSPNSRDLGQFTFDDLGGDQLVFVDGYFASALSTVGDHAKVYIGSVAQLLRDDPSKLERYIGRCADVATSPFNALNTAFFADGACVIIPRGAVIEGVIHILHLSSGPSEPVVSYPRNLIVVGENSQATIVESYGATSDNLYFTNSVTEVYVGASSVIDHYKLVREGDKAQHVGTMQVEIQRAANFTSQNITMAGGLVRSNVGAHLAGEGIVCTLNGLYMGRDRQLVDNHTLIDHAMPNCESHELYKGILSDKSRGVFNGKIMVRPDAQKTDAKQTNKTLLLSKEATIDTKPQLEIFADDVKCTHGAAVGQVDEEAIFYLRTRGIGEADARSMMTYAFASDIITRIAIEPIRRRLDQALFAELGK